MLKFNYEIKKYIYIYTYIYFKYVSSFIPIFPRMFIWKLTVMILLTRYTSLEKF